MTGKGHEVRAAFWAWLVNNEGPLGALGVSELAQLRSLLRHALTGTSAQQAAPTALAKAK